MSTVPTVTWSKYARDQHEGRIDEDVRLWAGRLLYAGAWNDDGYAALLWAEVEHDPNVTEWVLVVAYSEVVVDLGDPLGGPGDWAASWLELRPKGSEDATRGWVVTSFAEPAPEPDEWAVALALWGAN